MIQTSCITRPMSREQQSLHNFCLYMITGDQGQ